MTEREHVEFDEQMREARDKFLDGMTQTAAVTHERAALKTQHSDKELVGMINDLRRLAIRQLYERVTAGTVSDCDLIALLVALRK